MNLGSECESTVHHGGDHGMAGTAQDVLAGVSPDGYGNGGTRNREVGMLAPGLAFSSLLIPSGPPVHGMAPPPSG